MANYDAKVVEVKLRKLGCSIMSKFLGVKTIGGGLLLEKKMFLTVSHTLGIKGWGMVDFLVKHMGLMGWAKSEKRK